METGIFPGVPYEVYASWPGLRSSYLRHFRRTPAHAHYQALHPDAPSPAMDLGNLIHTAILEPERLEQRYVRTIKVDRRFKEGKAQWAAFEAQHAGRELVEPQDWEMAQRIREAVWGKPWAQALLGGAGSTELSVRWMDGEFDAARCKARIDRYCAEFEGLPALVDLKSARDASRDAFRADVERFAYGLQAAFYLDGLAAVQPHYRRWLWIVVEKSPPYAVALYEADGEVLEEGRRLYRAAIATHLECWRTALWPDYPDKAQLIGRPPWARRAQEASL